MSATTVAVLVAVAVLLLVLALSVRQVQQYERGVVFRFGRVLPDVRGPGLRWIVPFADRMVKVTMQTVVLDVPAQGAISRDNVTVTVDAVVYFRVLDPVKALGNRRRFPGSVPQGAQDALRTGLGPARLDTLL